MLLICASTYFEIEPTVKWLDQNKIKDVEWLITGVGMLQATYEILNRIKEKKYSFLIQAGVAGSIRSGIPKGSSFIVRSDSIGDLGVVENGSFRSIFDLSLADPDVFPFQKGKLVNESAKLYAKDFKLADATTVNEISTNADRIRFYEKENEALLESMEGAAFHYVALKQKIPFLQLRTISNEAGDRNKENWDLHLSITNLNRDLQLIIKKKL